MTSRQVRRAQERRARKRARKAEVAAQQLPTNEAPVADALPATFEAVPARPPRQISAARLAANRANSQLSTGPQTVDGKAKSSLNALKTGLTGRTIVLPTDDAAQYQRHVDRFFAEHEPCTGREAELVQALADTQWRLNRIPTLEAGIYAVARLQFSNMFAEQDASIREGLIDAQAFLTYQKQLNNLSIQELRLRRQYQKDAAALAELKAKRLKDASAEAIGVPPNTDSAPPPTRIGFEFSSDNISFLNDHLHPAQEAVPDAGHGFDGLPQAA